MPEKYQCKICKKIFSRRWNLQRHLKDVHSIPKTFPNDFFNQIEKTSKNLSLNRNNKFYNTRTDSFLDGKYGKKSNLGNFIQHRIRDYTEILIMFIQSH